MTAPLCDNCGLRLTRVRECSLVFERRKKRDLRDPFIAHDECFNDGGCYVIGLHQIIEPGDSSDPFARPHSLAKWQEHMRTKAWVDDVDLDALDRAHAVAVSLVSGSVSANRRLRSNTKATPALRARVMERDGFRCRRCGATPNDARLVIDHVRPLSRGGRTTFDNLQTLCDECNAGKRDHAPHPHDFSGKEE